MRKPFPKRKLTLSRCDLSSDGMGGQDKTWRVIGEIWGEFTEKAPPDHQGAQASSAQAKMHAPPLDSALYPRLGDRLKHQGNRYIIRHVLRDVKQPRRILCELRLESGEADDA